MNRILAGVLAVMAAVSVFAADTPRDQLVAVIAKAVAAQGGHVNRRYPGPRDSLSIMERGFFADVRTHKSGTKLWLAAQFVVRGEERERCAVLAGVRRKAKAIRLEFEEVDPFGAVKCKGFVLVRPVKSLDKKEVLSESAVGAAYLEFKVDALGTAGDAAENVLPTFVD